MQLPGAYSSGKSSAMSWTGFAADGQKAKNGLAELTNRMTDLQQKVANADPKMKEAAQKFEAYYVQQFLQLAAPDPDTDQLFYGGLGEEMFKDKMYEYVGDAVAKRGGFGIADQIIGQMVQRQEATLPTTPAKAASAYAAIATE